MRASWRECALGDIARIKHGYAFKGEFFGSVGTHVVLTPGNFHEAGGFKEKTDKAKWYSGSVPDEYVLDAGDLIVAMTEQGEGLLGSSALVPRSGFYLHNQRLGLVTPVSSATADRGFLYYLFNSRSVRQQIRASANGAKIRHTSPTRIYEVKVRVPDIGTQRHIATILSAYDNLIENNARRIAILEEMARRIYEEWFVRFRFPGHEGARMVESELGLVPEGWAIRAFDEVATFTNGYAFKPEDWGSVGVPIVKIKELKAGVQDDTPRFAGSLPDRYRIRHGDLLFSWSADLDVYIWGDDEGWLNQHLFLVHAVGAATPRSYLFHALKAGMPAFRRRSNGATMKHIKRSALSEVKAVVPSVEILAAFEQSVGPLHELVKVFSRKNRNLRTTRDLLLPKLISGELDVSAMSEPEALAA